LLGLTAPAAAGDATEPAAGTIRVMGEATVTSQPDQAEIILGVVTRAPTSQQAAAGNARALQNALAALRKVIGPRDEIETVSYMLQPDYRYSQDAPPKIMGYTATNTVRVKLNDLSRVATVLVTATQAGANQVERIRFVLENEDAAQANALRLAALEARRKANGLASTLGLQIAGIHTVEETHLTPRPLYDLEVARAAGAPSTPILPAGIETTARVTLTVKLAHDTRSAARPRAR
jgi:uncharacterized protein YggE